MGLSKAQIGRCGELFVQFCLLRQGIESSLLTTDTGIDLVAYAPRQHRAVTVQVKTNLAPKPGGGKGKRALDWWADDRPKADVFAFVDLDSRRIWLLEASELPAVAQQHSSGRFHFYMVVDPTVSPRRDGKRHSVEEFSDYLFEKRITKIFG
jgi:hypothetical protein